MERIKRVLDKYFHFMDEIGGNSFIEELIPAQLINKEKEPKFEGTLFWKAINSTIKENEISELEEYYRHKFPLSYKLFLQHRHFIDLQLGEYSIGFFKNLPNTIVNDTKEEIENCYWNLVERNYLPFASLSDYGVLCFDANHSNPDYPIVSFDHEDEYDKPEIYASNFEAMFEEFETHLDDWIKSKREKRNLT
ncbi:MAG: SMI1/KNR4 family protein [Saprospiraceae bacterium]